MTRSGVAGSAKFAVPTATAVAPAHRNSIASAGSTMPPMPRIGIFTAAAACQTRRTATGCSAGPESPPCTLPRKGRRRSTSITIAGIVLLIESASAPASSAARAKTVTSGTFGASFTSSGSRVAARAAETTAESVRGSVPNAAPPPCTFGHETLSSSAETPSSAESRRATSAYSSTESPQMLQIAGTPSARRNGSASRTNPSTPGPCSPIALSIPPRTSAMRGCGLPSTGSSRMPLHVMAPRRRRSTYSAYSRPYPNVPDATVTGFRMRRPPRSTERSGRGGGVFVSMPPSATRPGRARPGGRARRA